MMRKLMSGVFLAAVCTCNSVASADLAQRVKTPVLASVATHRASETFVKTNVLKLLLGEELSAPGGMSDAQ